MSRKTDSTAHMVKRMATIIMMAPTALLELMAVKEAIQPLEATHTHTHTPLRPTDMDTHFTAGRKQSERLRK